MWRTTLTLDNCLLLRTTISDNSSSSSSSSNCSCKILAPTATMSSIMEDNNCFSTDNQRSWGVQWPILETRLSSEAPSS